MQTFCFCFPVLCVKIRQNLCCRLVLFCVDTEDGQPDFFLRICRTVLCFFQQKRFLLLLNFFLQRLSARIVAVPGKDFVYLAFRLIIISGSEI